MENTGFSKKVTLYRADTAGSWVTFTPGNSRWVRMDTMILGKGEFGITMSPQEAQEWLEAFLKDGFEVSSRLIGYHDTLPISKGQEVTIPKGTLVRTLTKGSRRAGKTYKVRVHHTLCGMDSYHGKDPLNPEVVWAGPGGYWSYCDINDVRW